MSAVEDIKARLNIEDVVGDYVRLKRAGRSFKGLSPFTNEKTPSFMVSPEKQIWHDFSSGRGGDLFSFIQEIEGVDFKRSLELLARKAGVDLEQYQNKSSAQKSASKQKQELYQAIEQAVVFYQRAFTQSEKALNYARKARNFSKKTILDFRFGYSPANGNLLLEHLLKKGYSKQLLQKAGLVNQRNGRFFDMFRDRLMIPLRDSQGRVVGFTARLLGKNDQAPKYINTPATLLYDKGRQLYGFSLAKQAIRKSGFVVVVEGNLDVVSSHQIGVANVVGAAGTALTEFHLKELQRFTGDIRIAFDNDRAGQQAALRTIPLAQKLKLDLGVITVPDGQDPDELIRQNPQKWIKLIEEHQYMVDWLIEQKKQTHDLKTANGKRKFVDEILEIVAKLEDPVEREHYLAKLSEIAKTSLQSLNKKFELLDSKQPRVLRRRSNNTVQLDDQQKQLQEIKKSTQHFLALASQLKIVVQKWLPLFPKEVFDEQSWQFAESLTNKEVQSEQDYGKIIALLFEEVYQHTDQREQLYQAKNVAIRLAKQYVKHQKNQLLGQFSTANQEKEQQLLQEVNQLDKLLNKITATVKGTEF